MSRAPHYQVHYSSTVRCISVVEGEKVRWRNGEIEIALPVCFENDGRPAVVYPITTEEEERGRARKRHR